MSGEAGSPEAAAPAPWDGARDVAALRAIMARLYAPGGCPWDGEQTHESLRGSLIEESHEAVEAIDRGDLAGLSEELGDLLMQIVFHTTIAEAADEFSFDEVVEAIREAKGRGFRVTTNSTFFNTDTPESVRGVLDFLNDDLGVDSLMVSPGYAYEKAPDQEHFLQVAETRRLFREAFADGRRKRWRLNHSPLFLDFLEGKADFQCTPWGIPSYSVFGWQRPCYLMADGYAESYQELIETTDWDSYGRGRDERCATCMAHCGYEPSAVIATAGSLRQSLRALVAS